MNYEKAVQEFWRARDGGPFPDHWLGGFDMDIAYRICLALIDRHAARGEKQAGWKVALTAKAIQRQLGVDSPAFAVLFEHGRWHSGVEHPVSNLTRPGFEHELCLTLGETLRGPDISIDQATAAIASVAPALEIIESRSPEGVDAFPLSTADNGQQRAFVVGPETAFDPRVHDLSKTSVAVFINGEHQETAYGSTVIDSSPVVSIQWLANKLAEFDLALEAGSQVMTGSFTKQYRFDEALEIESRFDPFGSVTARFT